MKAQSSAWITVLCLCPSVAHALEPSLAHLSDDELDRAVGFKKRIPQYKHCLYLLRALSLGLLRLSGRLPAIYASSRSFRRSHVTRPARFLCVVMARKTRCPCKRLSFSRASFQLCAGWGSGAYHGRGRKRGLHGRFRCGTVGP